MKFLSNLLSLLSGLFLFYLAFLFLKWYIKGHFGKYFILFWLWSIFSVFTYIDKRERLNRTWPQAKKSGNEMWRDHWSNR